MAAAFDVWFVAADTVYRGVPAGTLTGWAEQGRVGADDKVRPAGGPKGREAAWTRAADHPAVADFLFRRGRPAGREAFDQLPAVDIEPAARRRAEDDDDDVDMIPLIDISLVLLIFFMMTTAVAALSPVDVPGMENASELQKDADAFTVHVDKRADGEVVYALRVGDAGPQPEDNNLPTLPDLLTRLDARLREAPRPPEVRIACHKDLPSRLVRNVTKELDARKRKDQIGFYGAEVNEVKK